jgi:hypothetical protein
MPEFCGARRLKWVLNNPHWLLLFTENTKSQHEQVFLNLLKSIGLFREDSDFQRHTYANSSSAATAKLSVPSKLE